jgi:hypothetical protein
VKRQNLYILYTSISVMISQYKLGKLSEKKEELGELRKNFIE